MHIARKVVFVFESGAEIREFGLEYLFERAALIIELAEESGECVAFSQFAFAISVSQPDRIIRCSEWAVESAQFEAINFPMWAFPTMPDHISAWIQKLHIIDCDRQNC